MAIADSVRAACPCASTACSSARAFMTVASMPMESPRARSMPLSAPCSPRKKLPPPTTTATSAPALAAAARSLAMRVTVSGSSPCDWAPCKASPDSLTSTRLKRGCAGDAVISGLLSLLLSESSPLARRELRAFIGSVRKGGKARGSRAAFESKGGKQKEERHGGRRSSAHPRVPTANRRTLCVVPARNNASARE